MRHLPISTSSVPLFFRRAAKSSLSRSSLLILGLRIVNVGTLFLIALFLARALGPAEYGIYAFGVAVLGLLVVFSKLGFDGYLARQLPAMAVSRDEGGKRGLVRRAGQLSSVASLAMIALWGGAWALLPGLLSAALWQAGLLALAALLPFTLLHIHQGRRRGEHRPGAGLVPLMLVQPLLFLALFVGLERLAGIPQAGNMALALLGSTIVITWLGVALMTAREYGARPPASGEGPERRFETRHWLKESLPFVAVGGLSVLILQCDTLMIGAILGARETGLYQPATRVALLVSIALTIVNQPLGPIISRHFVEGRKDALQVLLDRVSVVVSLFAIALTAMLLLFGGEVLGLFGEEFRAAQPALSILAVGQCANALLGPCGQLLVMMGRQRLMAALLAVAAVVNVALNLLLIPRYGIEGAAMATTVALVLWNVCVAVAAARLVGIRSTPLLRWVRPR